MSYQIKINGIKETFEDNEIVLVIRKSDGSVANRLDRLTDSYACLPEFEFIKKQLKEI